MIGIEMKERAQKLSAKKNAQKLAGGMPAQACWPALNSQPSQKLAGERDSQFRNGQIASRIPVHRSFTFCIAGADQPTRAHSYDIYFSSLTSKRSPRTDLYLNK